MEEMWCKAVWEREGFRLPGTGVRPLGLCSWTSLPASTRLERDLARWMLSTVGGAMCFPPLTLCFVNNFRCPCGDLQLDVFGTRSCFHMFAMCSHASRHLSADFFSPVRGDVIVWSWDARGVRQRAGGEGAGKIWIIL